MSRKKQEIEQLLKDASFPEEQIPAMCSDMLGLRTRHAQKKRAGPLKKTKKIKSAEQSQETREVLLDYISFMRKNTHPNLEWISQNVPMLLLLLNKVREQKGIVQILSFGQWNKVFKQLTLSHHIFMSYTQKEMFDIYLRNVIQYEFYVAGKPLNLKKGVDMTHSIKEGHFVRGRLKEIMNGPEKGVQMYEYQVVVFPKGVDELGIKYEDINLNKIQQECGDQFVEIRIQNPMDYSFNFRKLTNISHKMTIKQYCEYQKHVNDEQYKQKTFGDTLKNGRIYFGVNFEPSRLQIFSQLWKHLQGNFLGYRQPFDLLSYLDQDIPGCSSPQFYLKVKGCWTGGHQQNINMCAVNINHGPDPSQWYTIPYEYVEKIRGVLQEKFKCDLYRDQGLWFEKIKWFIENGYPIKRILQQKGDIVISGPGTLHWVRSYGIALQSAWNVFPLKYHMIQAALHRHNQNEVLRHERAGTIPLKALLIKFLDHQLYTLDQKSLSLILANIEIWKNRQQRLRINLNQTLLNFNLDSISITPVKDVESVCLVCKQEVFMYYIHDWDGDGIACLGCLQENIDKLTDKTFQLYIKYDPKDLRKLLQHAYNRQKFRHRPLETRFCDGTHIGRVTCSVLCQQTRKRTYQEYLKTHQQEKLSNSHQKANDTLRQNPYFFKEKSNQQRSINKEAETQTESMSFNCSRHQSHKQCSQPRKDYKNNDYYEKDSSNRYDKVKYERNDHLGDYQKQGSYYERSNFDRNGQHNHNNKYRNQRNHNIYNEDRRGHQRQFTYPDGSNRGNQRYNTYDNINKTYYNKQYDNLGQNQYEQRSIKNGNYHESQDIQY